MSKLIVGISIYSLTYLFLFLCLLNKNAYLLNEQNNKRELVNFEYNNNLLFSNLKSESSRMR